MRGVTAGFVGSLLAVALAGCGSNPAPDATATTTGDGDPADVVARVLPTSGDLARINTTTLAVTTVKLAPGIGWTAYVEHDVWVANGTTGTVTRVDGTNGTAVATVKVGPKPLDGDVVDGVVWVPDKGGDLDPIDASTDAVGTPVASHSATPFVVAGWSHLLWVVDFAGTDVIAIDPTEARG